jgi:hypothetical protein
MSNGLERVAHQIQEGEIVSLSEVVDRIAFSSVPAQRTASLPVPRQPTSDQLEAVKALPEVFAQVVPDTFRALSTDEVNVIAYERDTLKTLEKMIKERVDDITITVHNHLDTEAEEEGRADDVEHFTKNGNLCLPGEVLIDGTDKKFTREVSTPKAKLSASTLKKLSEDETYPDFTHEDYLAMTRQERVVDEAKVLDAVRKNPDLLRAVRDASERPNPIASINVRNA